jgi:membrane-bound serine protease (ClpP class)
MLRGRKQVVISRKNCVLLVIASCLLCLSSYVFAQSQVYVLKFSGPIGPVSSDYIISGIEQAEAAGAIGVVLKLDTPGGLDESMREIIQKIFNSKVPVITYVYPSGARAASAGVFITLASDFAVMAPGTNIGAAHPVSVGGKEVTPEMQEKITNDAASYIVSIAEKRNRNKKWAEQAVRQSVSVSSTEAAKLNVVDFIARDDADLFTKLDSVLAQREKADSIKFVSAQKKEIPIGARQKFLLFLTNPNVAYILLMLGVYGLFFELQSPGAIFPGVIGAVCLILGFYSLHLLPTNYAALALIGVAIIFFILEVYVTSYGLLTIGGVVALTLGSLLLFQSPAPYFRLAVPVIVAAVVLTVLFFALIIGLAIRAHKKKVTTGKEGLLLEVGIAETDLKLEGTIMIHGELWQAESVEGEIQKGEKVKVTAVEGMKLMVSKIKKKQV